MPKPRVLLCCGGRKYRDVEAAVEALDEAHAHHPIALVIHGAAPGADLICERWARSREIDYRGCPAPWKTRGKKAGPERNKRMLAVLLRYRAEGWPVACFALPGQDGTAHMVSLCRAADVPILGCYALPS